MTIPHEQEMELDKVVFKPGSWEVEMGPDDWLMHAGQKQSTKAGSREAGKPALHNLQISATHETHSRRSDFVVP